MLGLIWLIAYSSLHFITPTIWTTVIIEIKAAKVRAGLGVWISDFLVRTFNPYSNLWFRDCQSSWQYESYDLEWLRDEFLTLINLNQVRFVLSWFRGLEWIRMVPTFHKIWWRLHKQFNSILGLTSESSLANLRSVSLVGMVCGTTESSVY